MKSYLFIFALCICHIHLHAQQYSRQDSLRGMITKERVWWDLSYYDLSVKVNLDSQTLQGKNVIKYKVVDSNQIMQIDLQPPMEIISIQEEGKSLKYKREGNCYFIALEKKQVPKDINEITIAFAGKPRIAPQPPWDSGMVWEKDSLGNHFAASIGWVAGSSLWWPCKDHMYDEVDSLKLSINVPREYIAVGNGRLIKVENGDAATKTYTWFVSNPINNYGVNFNIGKYAHFSEQYKGENGPLDCNYYVLKENVGKAKQQFKQVKKMLQAFEHWFGPYPFYEDGYKLVEVPYLGMEHQSATAYGNDYMNGYKGTDLSNSGWGNKFDFILVHESGHEWFACNITFQDIADIWIHESFTSYSEGLYVEYHFGKEAGQDYLIGIRRGIQNDQALIGDYDINYAHYTNDNYVKGANMLHMLRQIINDDQKWREILRGLNRDFYHQTVTSQQIENYIAEKSGLNLNAFWDQYLRTKQVPVLEYYLVDKKLSYRWINCIKKFDMPVKVTINGKEEWLTPTSKWQVKELLDNQVELKVDRNFYVPTMFSNQK